MKPAVEKPAVEKPAVETGSGNRQWKPAVETGSDAPNGKSRNVSGCDLASTRFESECFCYAALVSFAASRLLWLPHCVAALLACARRALTARTHSLLSAALNILSFAHQTIKHVFVVFDAEHLTTIGFLELHPASWTSGYFAKLLIFGHQL